MRLYGPINSGVASGGAGTATANADSGVALTGKLNAVVVRYNDTPPGTTDVIVRTKGTNAPQMTFLTLTNANTDGVFRPRAIPHDVVGAALSTLTIAEPMAFSDQVNVSIAQANNGDSIDIWLLIEDC